MTHELEIDKEEYLNDIRDAYRDLRLAKRITNAILVKADVDKIIELAKVCLLSLSNLYKPSKLSTSQAKH